MAKSKNNPLVRGFKSKANKTSLILREELGLKPYDKLCGFELAKHKGVYVYTLIDFGIQESEMQEYSEWSAVTLLNKQGDRIIIHNHTHSSKRQQSNIMHELAHVICNHKMRDIVNGLKFVLMRDFDEDQEAEADCLGGSLQLPREALLWALRRGMDKKSIAEFYNASIQMVTKRVNETGVMKQLSYKKTS